MAKELKVRFQFDRSTKGAHRFQEIDKSGNILTTNDKAVIGTLYLRKSSIGEDAPKKLIVNITTD